MSKVREKKLKLIRSEISEITDLVKSHYKNIEENTTNSIDSSSNEETIHTLTNIIDNQNNHLGDSNFRVIESGLKEIKTILIENEKILKEILLKIN